MEVKHDTILNKLREEDAGSGVGGAIWGSITGILSDQTDLQAALDLKLTKASNLSDLTDASAARSNLGLGSIALLSSIDISSNTNLAVTAPITLSGDTVGFDVATTTLTKYLLLTGGTLTGPLLIDPLTDSTAQFRIRNAALTNTLFNVDTSTTPTQVLSVNDASFETSIGGWVAKGAATITRDTSKFYFGAASMKVVTTAAIGDGAKIPITITNSNKHAVTLYILVTATSFTTANPFSIGISPDGSDETSFISSTYIPTTAGWNKLTFSITPTGVTGSAYLFIKQTTAQAHTYYIDGVVLQNINSAATNTTLANPYYEGLLTVASQVALINNAVTIKPLAPSNNIFNIVSSIGRNLVQVDEITNQVQINRQPNTIVSGTAFNFSSPTIANSIQPLHITGGLMMQADSPSISRGIGFGLIDGPGNLVGRFFMFPQAGNPSLLFENRVGATGVIQFATKTSSGIGSGATRIEIQPGGQVGFGSFALANTDVPLGFHHIRGIQDEIQEIVQAWSTQTTSLFEWWDSTGAVINKMSGDGLLSLRAGLTTIGANFARVGGVIFDHNVDSTVGGAEADIYTDTTPASILGTNGDKIVAEYGINFVTVGTELTQLKVYFGGTAIWDSTALAPATGTTSARVYVEIIRVDVNTVRYTVSLNTSGASGYVYCTVGALAGLTLTNTNILKITGTSSGVGSGSGDIVGKMSYGLWYPAQ